MLFIVDSAGPDAALRISGSREVIRLAEISGDMTGMAEVVMTLTPSGCSWIGTVGDGDKVAGTDTATATGTGTGSGDGEGDGRKGSCSAAAKSTVIMAGVDCMLSLAGLSASEDDRDLTPRFPGGIGFWNPVSGVVTVGCGDDTTTASVEGSTVLVVIDVSGLIVTDTGAKVCSDVVFGTDKSSEVTAVTSMGDCSYLLLVNDNELANLL